MNRSEIGASVVRPGVFRIRPLTITLNGLAAGRGHGRASEVVKYTDPEMPPHDVLVFIRFTYARNPEAGDCQYIYAYAGHDGVNYPAGITGLDSAVLIKWPHVLALAMVAVSPERVIGPISLAHVFGMVPRAWGIVVCTDIPLSAVAAENQVRYVEVWYED